MVEKVRGYPKLKVTLNTDMILTLLNYPFLEYWQNCESIGNDRCGLKIRIEVQEN